MNRRPWWLWVASASFIAYFSLIEYTGWTSGRLAFNYTFNERTGMVVRDIAPVSMLAKAGIQADDRLIARDGLAIGDPFDWLIVMASMPAGRETTWTIERQGVRQSITVPGIPRRALTPAPTYAFVTAFQLMSLVLALILAWRASLSATTLLGAWLLASVATSLLPLWPRTLAATWHDLPPPLGALVWPAAISSMATPIALFLFCAHLARPAWPVKTRIAAIAPIALVLAYMITSVALTVYAPARAVEFPLPPWLRVVGPLSFVVYFFAATILLATSLRHQTDPTNRRRVTTVLAGAVIGSCGLLLIGAGFLLDALTQFGRATAITVTGAVMFVFLPISIAYATIRHRLFDIRVIARMGLQYALARGAVLAVVPIVGIALVADLLIHGDQPLRAVLAGRGWTYGTILAVAFLAYSQRGRWMTAIDRRFFRERYAAHQILKDVVEDIRSSTDLDTAAAKVVSRIDSALHPRLVAVMRKPKSATAFTGPRVQPLNATNAVARVVRALARPVSFGTKGLRDLPEIDKAWLTASDVELIVPIVTGEGQDEALLVLGPKKSEEPYAPDDLDLLGAIAASLSMVMGRSRSELLETRTVVSDGRRLGNRYRLETVLGEGGMGIVYAAVDETLGRPVAVKLMHDEQLKGPGGLERFQREARAAASLTHPHIVTVHDFGVDAGEPYLVMERLSGRSLRSELHRQKRIKPDRALTILRGIAGAVEAAHARGIIHRDLKPENVFLAESGSGESAKVLDFGIAKITGHEGAVAATSTSTGVLIGTLPYMSPEQIGGGNVAPSWDIWSLAVIAYEMLSGVHPFKEAAGGSGLPISRAPKISAFAPDLSPNTDECFECALSLDPARRPTTASAFVDSMRQP